MATHAIGKQSEHTIRNKTADKQPSPITSASVHTSSRFLPCMSSTIISFDDKVSYENVKEIYPFLLKWLLFVIFQHSSSNSNKDNCLKSIFYFYMLSISGNRTLGENLVIIFVALSFLDPCCGATYRLHYPVICCRLFFRCCSLMVALLCLYYTQLHIT